MSEAFAAGAWRTLRRGEVYIGGKWRTLTRAEMYIDSQWRQVLTFIPPLSVSASPVSVFGSESPSKPITATVTTSTATATPTGGQSPYSYHWAVAAYTGSVPTIVSPNSATTNFKKSVPANTEQEADFTLTVTDNVGETATTTVHAVFSNQSLIG